MRVAQVLSMSVTSTVAGVAPGDVEGAGFVGDDADAAVWWRCCSAGVPLVMVVWVTRRALVALVMLMVRVLLAVLRVLAPLVMLMALLLMHWWTLLLVML